MSPVSLLWSSLSLSMVLTTWSLGGCRRISFNSHSFGETRAEMRSILKTAPFLLAQNWPPRPCHPGPRNLLPERDRGGPGPHKHSSGWQEPGGCTKGLVFQRQPSLRELLGVLLPIQVPSSQLQAGRVWSLEEDLSGPRLQEVLPGLSVGGRGSFWPEQRGYGTSCPKAHRMCIFIEPGVITEAHAHTCAHTRMYLKHTHLPTNPMHRSLHMPPTHMPTLVHTCVGGPNPGGDPPLVHLGPELALRLRKTQHKALCPLGSRLPTRRFTGHL